MICVKVKEDLCAARQFYAKYQLNGEQVCRSMKRCDFFLLFQFFVGVDCGFLGISLIFDLVWMTTVLSGQLSCHMGIERMKGTVGIWEFYFDESFLG